MIEALRRTAGTGSALLDLKNEIDDGIGQIGLAGSAQAHETWLHGRPAELQREQRRCGGIGRIERWIDGSGLAAGAGRIEVDAELLSAFGEAVSRLGEGGDDAAIAFGVRDV